MSWKHLGMLIALGGLWGGSYLFMRIAGPVLGPIVLIAARVMLAAAALWLYCLVIGERLALAGRWRQMLLMGTLNNAIPFVLITYAVIHLNASIAGIINATMPLFTAVVAAIWLREPLSPRRVLGVLSGISGVGVLVGLSPLPLTGRTLSAAGASLAAAFSYGVAVVYARLRFRALPPEQTAVGQLTAASLLLAPLALAGLPRALPAPLVAGAVLALALVCTALAYLIYFRLIAEAGATQASTVTFLVPFFGVLWGALFLGEPLNAGVFLGLAIIVFSVWLVLGR